jgi:AcrR family transcriptional regulator
MATKTTTQKVVKPAGKATSKTVAKTSVKTTGKASTKTAAKTSRKTSLQTSAATPRGDDRQAQLLGIACRLFSERGFNGTSLRDIAEEAKVTKAALYYHFPNKESLFAKIVLESLEALVNQVKDACAEVDAPEAKVKAFMVTTAENYQHNREAWIASSTTAITGVTSAFFMSSSTFLAGMGLDSRNSRLCRGMSMALIFSASSFCPALEAASILCMLPGATLAVTEMTPSPPMRTKSHPESSSPL